MTFKRLFLFFFLVILLAGGVWLAKLIWFKPFNIDHFYERVFIEYALNDPELLTQMGMLPSWLDFPNAKLTDASVEHAEKMMAKARDDLQTLRSYDYQSQTPEQQLSTDILDGFLQHAVDGEAFAFHNYPVNQLFGVQSNLPTLMLEAHPLRTARNARHYAERLEAFPTKLEQVVEGLEYRRQQGILPPRFVFDHVIDEMREFIDTPAAQHLLATHFAEALEDIEDLDEQERDELIVRVEQAVETAVYPAYASLITWFSDNRELATEDDGVWKLPNGEAYYAHLLRGFTTTDLDAETIHEIGRREVDSIVAEMDSILRGEGYTEGTVGERMSALAEEPRFLYPDNDQGREQILTDYQAQIDEAMNALDGWFNILPEAPVEVRRIPEFKEATSAGAYYNAPARDGSRPGVFYANLRDVSEVPRFGMRTLSYHEAVPGHHFQIALQAEMEGVPMFRSFPLFTAYTEGWALYAEQVAAEAGLQEDPYDRLGYLQAALFRAVRLVVDTGIHQQRWPREQAIEYMLETTGMPRGDVVAEIERYIVMPGQATAYMIGKLRILELREQAREQLGDEFDIAAFHDVVLGNGAVPLDVLEQLVEAWIADTLPTQAALAEAA